ncbi:MULTISPECIES: NUDIX hydrolase [unclassified Epibacterium]|jgi:8-oxo-dGTP pyrophosphatase MutT (NUDIX family)|uniref:NUDIX hydrolase n=1 Tax=unclassified Epibacterium TaxID=2639179 RepID=UPI001EF61C0E|nr:MULTISPECIES: NUDIX hydrolase [unclassified Epibacterium]MCG7622928.1 NUDIX hydrolase [Epibacterium sp. Ofav1-8]MCG7627577.1 NUDIX hydrolase [Epibacterium sp. MM17-32]
MLNALNKLWSQTLLPMLSRPRRLQVAALCYRQTDTGREVLLITSRDTGRWVLPKGWPMAGKTSAESAVQEAWEEAGVAKSRFDETPLGCYSYDKRLDNGAVEPLETLVYAVEVQELQECFPEAHERSRSWMSPAEAATRVDEPELRDLLNNF